MVFQHIPHKRFFLILVAMLVVGSVAVQAIAPADDSEENQVIRIDRPVYFKSAAGNVVELQAGSYELEPLPDSLLVMPVDGSGAIELATNLNTHYQKLSAPIAVSVEGKPDGESADHHLLALYLPGGLIYQSEGSYSNIQSRSASQLGAVSSPDEIYLDKPVLFDYGEAGSQLVPPGSYRVDAVANSIGLIDEQTQDVILLKAEADRHDGDFGVPVALSLPGPAEEAPDEHYLVLLLPDGTSLEADGLYAVVQSRGLLGDVAKGVKKGIKKGKKAARKTVKKAKNTASNVGKRITSSPPSFATVTGTAQDMGNLAQFAGKQAGKTVRDTAEDGARFGQKAAMEAKKGAEWAAQQAAEGIKWMGEQACKLALEAAETGVSVASKSLQPLQGRLSRELMRPQVKRKVSQAIDEVVEQSGPEINKALEAAAILNKPSNIRTLKKLLKPETMCEKSPEEIQTTIQKMIGKPMKEALALFNKKKNSQVMSRSAGGIASASLGIGGGGNAGGGFEIGFRYATDFRDYERDQWFFDVAGTLKSSYGGDGGIVIGIFPEKAPKDTGGEFFAMGIGAGSSGKAIFAKMAPGFGGGIDFIFDFPWEGMGYQGFAITIGGGVAKATVVEGAAKMGTGIPL